MAASPVIAVPWPKADYLRALEMAGATPQIVAPELDAVADVLERADGILLTGGEDVEPSRYGGALRHPTVDRVDPARDEYELALARGAVLRDLPLLGICRGAQLLNVAAGGTLVQDIPTERPSGVPHVRRDPADVIAHPVRVTGGTRLAALTGDPDGRADLPVNSRHHQSVDAVAPGFVVAATAPDGVVEAIERPAAEFCLAVQWHPENFWRTGQFAALFEGFVAAARRRRANR